MQPAPHVAMHILKGLLLFFIDVLTTIGDITIFVFSLLWAILIGIQHSLETIGSQVLKIFHAIVHRRFVHKSRRHLKTLVAFSGSWKAKLRYFLLGILFSFCFLFIPLLVVIAAKILPDPTTLGQQQIPQTTKIYDRHHTLLYQFYANENRTVVPLKNIPLSLRQATIAIEDKNFYQNPGFDIIAIVRAAIADIRHDGFQGGSTITQQLIKSALLSSKQTLTRKVEELILAFWTEHIYSKDRILELYLNQVPYGGTAWGVEAAAQTYFGKDVQDLDLAQCAFLAGLPQAPSQYSPFGSQPTIWKQRQKEVLARMTSLGYIDDKTERQALQEELTFQTQSTAILAPHFVMYIKNLLIQKYGVPLVEKGGLTVTTSLDLSTQQMAQKIVSSEVAQDQYLTLSNGAAVISNPKNGDILAMIGSADYNNPDWGNVNIATSLRQPGSSIKVVTYAGALSHGYTPATTLDDSPVTYTNAWETYSPVNYDGKFHGLIPLRIALANSFNIPAVKTLNAIGIPAFVDLGRKMGISNLKDADQYGLSLTLGAAEVTMLDMATAYGTLANNGERVDLNPILQVTDDKGNVLEQKTTPFATQVLDPGVTFMLSNILSDNVARSWEFGSNSPLRIPSYSIPVKTGTTDNKRDNWTDGYTKNRVVIVWVGNNDNTPMSQGLASGITGAAPIWNKIMTNLVAKTKDDPYTPPSDIVSKPCLGRIEYFLKGTENSVNCAYSPVTPTPSIIP